MGRSNARPGRDAESAACPIILSAWPSGGTARRFGLTAHWPRLGGGKGFKKGRSGPIGRGEGGNKLGFEI
jgi:hypothetical protein